MIDLHTHSTFSDGELIPAELARRAKVAGYRAIAITDHADASNMDLVLPRVAAMAREYSIYMDMVILAGVELTHVPRPSSARRCGAPAPWEPPWSWSTARPSSNR